MKFSAVLIAAAVALSGCCFTGQSSQPQNITVTEEQQDEIIKLALHDTLTITLDENPTTGYQWQINKLDRSVLSEVSDTFEPSSKELCGSGGKRIIKLKAQAVGNCTFEATYVRPWEGASSRNRVFNVKISIENQE